MKPSHSAFSRFCMFLFFSVFNQRLWFLTVDFALQKDLFGNSAFCPFPPRGYSPFFPDIPARLGVSRSFYTALFSKESHFAKPQSAAPHTPGSSRLLCSLAAAPRPHLPTCSSPIFSYSSLPHTHVQPSPCSLERGR